MGVWIWVLDWGGEDGVGIGEDMGEDWCGYGEDGWVMGRMGEWNEVWEDG